jgi:hypothetical protein
MNAINLLDEEEFDPISPDCARESLAGGPASHGNTLAPSIRRNLDVSV